MTAILSQVMEEEAAETEKSQQKYSYNLINQTGEKLPEIFTTSS